MYIKTIKVLARQALKVSAMRALNEQLYNTGNYKARNNQLIERNERMIIILTNNILLMARDYNISDKIIGQLLTE